MKQKLSILAILLCVLLLCTSCTTRLAAVDSLIRAPKLTGVNLQVQQSLDQSVGEPIILKTPLSGEYSSAFVYRDLDNDLVNECIAFYALQSSDSVHMNILDTDQEGVWFSVGDTVGSGSDVASLTFADIDGNGRDEILVTWQIPESKSNQYLSVYGQYSSDSGVVSMINELYTAFHILDADADGSAELFLAVIEAAGDSYLASGRLFDYHTSHQQIELVSEMVLDPSVTSYANICHDYEGSICRLYLDGVVSETHRITELLEISASDLRLRAPSVHDEDVAAFSLRPGTDICSDINRDGYIEIPSYSLLPGSAAIDRDNAVSEDLYVTVWSRFSSGDMVPAYRYLSLSDWGYYFEIPDDWSGKVCVVKDLKLQRLRFYQIDENGNTSHMLFCIDWMQGSTRQFSEEQMRENMIYSDDNQHYLALITNYGADFGIEISDLISGFIKI